MMSDNQEKNNEQQYKNEEMTLAELLKSAEESVKQPMTVAHNRLLHEKSPYLLHHAFQPIDWYPWGEEAFQKAKEENKPIFLSIGYSTCHWCHVMAKESFEDHMIAQELNRNFVSIKVDREERPDIDKIYMKICQIMTMQGGWPLNMVLTPEGKPFYAATYLPKRRHHGRAGLMEILPQLAGMWRLDREKLMASAEQIHEFMEENLFIDFKGEMEGEQLFHEAYEQYQSIFDPVFGGFGGAPKFPMPQDLLYLLSYGHYYEHKGEDMVKKTLEMMYRGGIFDHIGHGFCRYSTDEFWLVPHFEKTLYDNALLIYTYGTAYHQLKEPWMLDIAKMTADYLLRELEHKDGGFYSGQDADADGVEGAFYLLQPEEVQSVLGDDAENYMNRYHISEQGQYQGWSIPHLDGEGELYTPDEAMMEQLEKLRAYRKKRYHLYVDDKVLTGWNGLAMAAFTKLWQVSGEEKYLEAAQKTHRFILRNLKDEQGYLAVRYRNGHVLEGSTLEDYAFYAWGLMTLHQSTFQAEYLVEFQAIIEECIARFFDDEKGGFYMTPKDGEKLIFRPKETLDGALPSGNSVLTWLLTKLVVLTNDQNYREILEKQIAFMEGAVSAHPENHGLALRALLLYHQPSRELICTTREFGALGELREFLRDYADPNLSVVVKTEANAKTLAKVSSFLDHYPILHHGADHFYYLCQNWRCHDGVTDIEALWRLCRGEEE